VESQRQERKEVQFPVSFVGDARGAGIVRNLSSGGCKIESDIRVRDTQLLVLRLAIPQETSPVVIDVAAVRWSHSRTFGVQFLSMKETEQQRIDRYLATLSPS
jgi:c-di-GMP-binding flagellar brake protein YcgR